MGRTICWKAVLLLALAAGCEADRTINIGALSVSPGALAFGTVDVGLSKQLRVSLTNPSASAVAVPGIKIASDPNQELALADLLTTDCKDAPRAGAQTLAPGECARFSVTYTPAGPHAAAGSIEIDPSNSNDRILLPVSGLGRSTLLPALRICALDEAGAVIDTACSALGALPPQIPTVDFGNGQPEVASIRTVRLFNEGEAILTFAPQPVLSSGTPGQFSLTGQVPSAQLAPGASADLTLTATPSMLGTITGELDLATNDPRLGLVPVPLIAAATGIAICVAPAVQLDYGLVLIGDHPEKGFALTNCGMGDVTVASDSFAPISPTTTQFTVSADAPINAGTLLHPGDQLNAAVTYTPTAVESDLAALQVHFGNSFGLYSARVGLSGSAVSTFCGTSVEPKPVPSIAAQYSVSGAGNSFVPFDPNATPSPVGPLDFVRVFGSVASGTASYTWTLVSQPAGSTTTLAPNGNEAAMQTLVSGDYVVELSAADASGCAGTTQVTIHVVPTGDVHIELTWAETCGDLDLHYVAPGGSICNSYDTAYYNTNPDWGCATQGCGQEQDPGGIYPDQTRSDDATLDHDDQWGSGPENITQQNPFDSPANDPYQIWVYYFSAVPDGGGGSGRCATAHPTINIYLGGTLANTFTLTAGLAPFAAWHAADLAVSNAGQLVQVIAGSTSSGNVSACSGNARRRAGSGYAKELMSVGSGWDR